MASKSEKGHPKNMAAFDLLISVVISFGEAFKPSRAALKLLNLQTVATSASGALAAVNTAEAEVTKTSSAFQAVYKPFDKLITRIINALKSTDAPEGTVKAAASIIRELRGARAEARKTEEQKKALAAEGVAVVEHSVSQVSIDNRLNNFDKLLKLLAATSQYLPNETDLTLESLTAYHADLKAKNDAAVKAEVALKKARDARDKMMYAPTTGLVDLGLSVKSYIKSAFDTAAYKQVAKISFKKIKV
ncbi:MAG TPA: hypothetical protein VHO90_14900 [Bacteroidales bacterium]|nr:hypothetical protein [Bacteroidales bacterium]